MSVCRLGSKAASVLRKKAEKHHATSMGLLSQTKKFIIGSFYHLFILPTLNYFHPFLTDVSNLQYSVINQLIGLNEINLVYLDDDTYSNVLFNPSDLYGFKK